MRAVKNKINKIFLGSMIAIVFFAVLFAPYFVSADFWSEASMEGEVEDCVDLRTFGETSFCVDPNSECQDNGVCADGQICAAKILGSADPAPVTGICTSKTAVSDVCSTNQDCIAKGDGNNACVAASVVQENDFFISNGYFTTTLCVANECTPGLGSCPGGKECKKVGESLDGKPIGECEEIEGMGNVCKIEGTGLSQIDIDCSGAVVTPCSQGLVCAEDSNEALAHQCDKACTNCLGVVYATIFRCKLSAEATCSSDADCGSALLVCGKVMGDGTKNCVAPGSLTEGQACASNKTCASGICANMDVAGVGKCTIATSAEKDLNQAAIETCKKIGGVTDVDPKTGKVTCYANPPEIKLMQPLGDKEVVKGIGDYIITIFNLSMVFGAVLAVLMIIIGGFLYATSGGGENITKAKQYIISALVGLVLISGAYVLFHTINPALIKMKPIAMEVVNPETLTCCKNADGQLKYASACEPGWTEVSKIEMCATGMAFGAPCCIGNKDSEVKCEKIGGICAPTEVFEKGACTVVAEIVGETASMGVAGLATGIAGNAVASSATNVLKGVWTVVKWVSRKGIKVVSVCARSLTCITGVVGGAVLADVLSDVGCSSDDTAGICIEKGTGFKSGDLCRFDKQCPASDKAPGKCCINFKSLACWGGGPMGYCTNGLSGPADSAGVGTCDLENPEGPDSCCSELGAFCGGFKPGGSGFVHGACSTGEDGHACLQKKDAGPWLGATYEPRNNWCKSGKCSEAGLCVGELQAGKVGGSCDDHDECPKNAWCVNLSKYQCETDNNPGCIEEAGVWLKCYTKYSAGKGCIEDVQCLGKCESNLCTGGEDGDECNDDVQCGPGKICYDKKCVLIKDGGESCEDDEECKTGLCAKCTNCEGKICTYGTEGKYCEEDEHCLDTLTCDEEKNKCASLGGQGEPCDDQDDCGPGFACFDNICTIGKIDGEDCGDDWECASKVCNPTLDMCGKVVDGKECEENKHCESGICNTELDICGKVADDKGCEENEHCVSGVCNTAIDECGKSEGGVKCKLKSECKSNMCNTAMSPDECVPVGGYQENEKDCEVGKHAMCGEGFKCVDTPYLDGDCSDGKQGSPCGKKGKNSDCLSGVCDDPLGANECL